MPYKTFDEMPDLLGGTTLQPVTSEAKKNWNAAVAAFNAKDANNQRTDITEQLDRARSTRLFALIAKKLPLDAKITAFAADPANDPKHVCNALSMIAGILVSDYSREGVTWAMMEAGFQAVICRDPDYRDLKVLRAMGRAGRAMRLIDRLVTAGVLNRGEVAGMS